MLQSLQDGVPAAFHAKGQQLDDQYLVVTVDHQAGQAIGLAMNQAQRVELTVDGLSIGQGLLQLVAKEIDAVDLFIVAGQQAGGDQ